MSTKTVIEQNPQELTKTEIKLYWSENKTALVLWYANSGRLQMSPVDGTMMVCELPRTLSLSHTYRLVPRIVP